MNQAGQAIIEKRKKKLREREQNKQKRIKKKQGGEGEPIIYDRVQRHYCKMDLILKIIQSFAIED